MVKVSAGAVVGTKDGTSELFRTYENGTEYKVKDGGVDVLDADGKTIATFHHFVWVEICNQ